MSIVGKGLCCLRLCPSTVDLARCSFVPNHLNEPGEATKPLGYSIVASIGVDPDKLPDEYPPRKDLSLAPDGVELSIT